MFHSSEVVEALKTRKLSPKLNNRYLWYMEICKEELPSHQTKRIFWVPFPYIVHSVNHFTFDHTANYREILPSRPKTYRCNSEETETFGLLDNVIEIETDELVFKPVHILYTLS